MAVNFPVQQLVITGEMHGSVTNNVFHFRHSTFDNNGLDSLIASVLSVVRNNFLPLISDQWQLRSVSAKFIEPQLSDERVVLGLATDKGALNTDALPAFNAVLMQMRSGLGGRMNRGRKYFPGLPEAHTSQGLIGDTQYANWQALAAALQSNFTAVNAQPAHQMVIYGRNLKDGNGNIIRPSRAVNVISIQAVNIVATMVSRKRGRGI